MINVGGKGRKMYHIVRWNDQHFKIRQIEPLRVGGRLTGPSVLQRHRRRRRRRYCQRHSTSNICKSASNNVTIKF